MTSAQPQVADQHKPGFDIAGYVAIVRRRWKFIVAVTVVGFAAAWFLAPRAAPRVEVSGPARYTATNTVLQLGGGMALDRVKFLSLLGEVPRRVAQQIGYTEDPSLLASEVDISIDPQVGSITFSTTQSDPDLAQQLANTWASETISYVANVQYDAMRTQVQELRSQIQQIDAQAAEAGAQLSPTVSARRESLAETVASLEEQLSNQSRAPTAPEMLTVEPAVARAVAPESPKPTPTSKISRPMWIAGLTFMTLALAIAAAIVLDRLDKRLHTREEVEDAYDETILAEVPTKAPVVTIVDPQSAPAESMRMLRTVLRTSADTNAKREVHLEDGHLAAVDAAAPAKARSVLVTSASPGEGKTYTALNLAMVFTEQQLRVLLVDADLRSPDASEYFGMGAVAGLSDLAGSALTDMGTIAATCRATDNPYLFLLPAGTTRERPALLLRGVREVIQAARNIVDVVIVDTTALLVANDTRELLSAVDGVLLVAMLGVSNEPAAEQTRELIDRLAPPVLGIALLGAGSGDTRGFRKMQRQSHSSVTEPEPAAAAPPDADAAAAASIAHDTAAVPVQTPSHSK